MPESFVVLWFRTKKTNDVTKTDTSFVTHAGGLGLYAIFLKEISDMFAIDAGLACSG